MDANGENRPGSSLADGRAGNEDAIDTMVRQLESQMPDLQARHAGPFALAAAWADRHDAILAATPSDRLAEVGERLRRIGIRWGVVSGPRVTQEITALPPLHKRQRGKR
jgi:hypothetical protein